MQDSLLVAVETVRLVLSAGPSNIDYTRHDGNGIEILLMVKPLAELLCAG